jgi:hypothetical protein
MEKDELEIDLAALAKRMEAREPIRISPEALERDRREFIAACEKSNREARAHLADAIEKVSHIYLTV